MIDKYLSNFQIVGSTIKNLKIRNDFITLGSNNVKRKIDVSHIIDNIDYVEENQVLSGIITLNIKVNISENKKKYILDLAVEGCFNAPSEIGEEIFKNMLEVNGITSLYSIARGFVQSTTSQTLLAGSVMLPMINVVAYSKDLNNRISEDK